MGKKGNQQEAALNTPFGIKQGSHHVPKYVVPHDFYHNSTSSEKHVLEILKFFFVPQDWSEFFHKEFVHITKRRQVMRMMIQVGTIDACLRGSNYYLPDGAQVRIDKNILSKSAASSKMYQSDFTFPKSKPASKLVIPKPSPSTKKPVSSTPISELNNNNNVDINNNNNNNNSADTNNTNSESETQTIASASSSIPPLPSSSSFSSSSSSSSSTPTSVPSAPSSVSYDSYASSSSSSPSSSLVTPFDITSAISQENVLIIDGDCLEAALWVKRFFKADPIVLNMASRSHPGGGYRNGAGAQEESIHRRTNMFQCLEDPFQVYRRAWSYPLPEFGGIYTKDAYVFRDNEEQGYGFKKTPETLSFVSVSAYSNPPVETQGDKVVLSNKIAILAAKKIETIFNIAAHNGHDTIVLGAFGCGAYANPAQHVSLLFKQAIKQFQSQFKLVVFAIIDQKSEMNPEGNLHYFSETFKCRPIKVADLP